MHREKPVSTTHQMYLKTLYRLSQDHPVGRVRDLASQLDVTPGSVSTSLNKLHELGLVDRERYGGAQLTAAGAAIAHCVVRRFETLKALLIELFGVDPERAEADACLMEHAVSPSTVNRMEALLERLRAGESINLEDLRHHHRAGKTACAECEAADVCRAIDTVYPAPGDPA